MDGSYILLVVLIAGVLFVNGFTDAPNAITGAVSSGTLTFRRAALLAALCNTLGLLLAWRFAPMVTDTICEMLDFTGVSGGSAVAALTAAMLSVILFAAGAWLFGIPTSESHAVIAALTGAAVALGGWAAVRFWIWSRVIWGLLLSCAGGITAGFLCGLCLRRLPGYACGKMQIACTALLAMLHGAQDGLKFVGVLALAQMLWRGARLAAGGIDVSREGGAVFFCAAAIALGALFGGRRIIRTVGGDMVALDGSSAAASDFAASMMLLASTLCGYPASTTHAKTCAVLGAGAAAGRPVDWRIAAKMMFAWLLTFPVCGCVGWLTTRLLCR